MEGWLLGGHCMDDVLSLLHSHQGLSGKSGPRGERGPTVSAGGRDCGSRSKRVYLGSPDNSLPLSLGSTGSAGTQRRHWEVWS